jgi:hypothetical protein
MIQTITIPQITQRLQQLPVDKLVEVYDFVSFLVEKKIEQPMMVREVSESFQTMLASEDVLRRDWESPAEERAWADL